jgi:hypothetical protein
VFSLTPADVAARLEARGRGAKADLAAFLGISRDKLSKSLAGARNFTGQEHELLHRFFEAGPLPAAPPPALAVAVYGLPEADGRVSLLEEVDRIAPPGRADWAVRIASDDMAPRLQEGELVFVRQGLPPSRGKDCVVELADGSGLVGLYHGRKDGFVSVQLLNPARVVSVPYNRVAGVHAVVFRL